MGSAQEVPQHRFRLIIGVMGEDDARATVFARAFSEEVVPGVSSSGFHRLMLGFHPAGYINAGRFKGESEFFRQAPDKSRFSRRSPPTQAVIDMADDEIPKTVFDQQVQ